MIWAGYIHGERSLRTVDQRCNVTATCQTGKQLARRIAIVGVRRLRVGAPTVQGLLGPTGFRGWG